MEEPTLKRRFINEIYGGDYKPFGAKASAKGIPMPSAGLTA